VKCKCNQHTQANTPLSYSRELYQSTPKVYIAVSGFQWSCKSLWVRSGNAHFASCAFPHPETAENQSV